MMLNFFKFLGVLGLILTLVAPIMYFIGFLELQNNYNVMLAGMICWYLGAIVVDRSTNTSK